MGERTRYLGLDAHKASISVAIAEEVGQPADYGRIPNDPSAVRRLVQHRGGPETTLVAAYEASPTSYALHRQLTALGVQCTVIAPSLTPVRPGDRSRPIAAMPPSWLDCCAAAT